MTWFFSTTNVQLLQLLTLLSFHNLLTNSIISNSKSIWYFIYVRRHIIIPTPAIYIIYLHYIISWYILSTMSSQPALYMHYIVRYLFVFTWHPIGLRSIRYVICQKKNFCWILSLTQKHLRTKLSRRIYYFDIYVWKVTLFKMTKLSKNNKISQSICDR